MGSIFLPVSGASKNHGITSNILQGCKDNVQVNPSGTVHAADTIDTTTSAKCSSNCVIPWIITTHEKSPAVCVGRGLPGWRGPQEAEAGTGHRGGPVSV